MKTNCLNTANLVADEVRDLHRFFQAWFTGTSPKTTEAFTRVSAVWPASFTLIDPTNHIHTAESLLASTFEQHASYPNLSIRIENLTVRDIADSTAAVALYEEWHVDDHETEVRLCSATLVRQSAIQDALLWTHIHESRLTMPLA